MCALSSSLSFSHPEDGWLENSPGYLVSFPVDVLEESGNLNSPSFSGAVGPPDGNPEIGRIEIYTFPRRLNAVLILQIAL